MNPFIEIFVQICAGMFPVSVHRTKSFGNCTDAVLEGQRISHPNELVNQCCFHFVWEMEMCRHGVAHSLKSIHFARKSDMGSAIVKGP